MCYFDKVEMHIPSKFNISQNVRLNTYQDLIKCQIYEILLGD